ncbi:short-chain dehydrogenase [Ochrobactrum sp. P6BS-III]|uniref:SDR family oxidoreductase n=1 Tax=Brucella haematophila TaxID=419474 RepID=A0ABX1DLE2_9HYPH|nr:SDR family oxidoreductase [Brucella haematophila]MBA8819727.1 NAD(P)-dependent dehydrogenase (short-subunit alcohol dehydrogenase family) [Ochrobactrum sp. P6BSIII]NKC03146.1 SDR family oxidoreductase [Brucella haematophila]OOL18709.1 short-chain dehydrogenase [Ochrobactrum sp. P6BS-III]TMU95699.1 SDR family oxidoreductase [Brucella haematophila]
MTIALITGGSRGLGRNAALHLAKQGVGIVLTYQSNAKAAEETVSEIAAEGGTAIALPLDTAKVASFADFAEKLRQALQDKWQRTRFDYLVNNAGYGVHKPFAETTEEDFDGLVNVHLKGVFFLTQTLLPLIEDGGKILNVSTGLARFALPGYSAYATMKGGIEVLTRYLARELGPRGIAVNAIAPGAIETDFGGGLVRDMPEVNKMIASTTAMGRVGRPDDIGGAVAAILSGGTGWITGQRIEVSGGQNI